MAVCVNMVCKWARHSHSEDSGDILNFIQLPVRLCNASKNCISVEEEYLFINARKVTGDHHPDEAVGLHQFNVVHSTSKENELSTCKLGHNPPRRITGKDICDRSRKNTTWDVVLICKRYNKRLLTACSIGRRLSITRMQNRRKEILFNRPSSCFTWQFSSYS